jgi:hypothetical protein
VSLLPSHQCEGELSPSFNFFELLTQLNGKSEKGERERERVFFFSDRENARNARKATVVFYFSFRAVTFKSLLFSAVLIVLSVEVRGRCGGVPQPCSSHA